jgi:raffinose/stachyose/melibiose transport system substrate-binding protein
MTRTLRAGLSALAVTAGLAGAASAQEVTIWSLTSGSEEVTAAWDRIVAEFQAANPDITVTLERRSTDEHKAALRVAAQSDQGPDIYFMWAGLGLGGEFVNAGLSAPLDDYYAQYGWDDRLVDTGEGFTRNYPPNRHGVPYTFRGEAIYYNKALFEQAGITELPDTYDELKAAAQALADEGIPAFTFGGTVNWHVMRLMDVILETQCGAETHDALKAMTLDWSTEPCATASFVEFHEWTSNYFLTPFMGIDQAQSFNLFMADRAAMMLEGDWLVNQVTEAGRAADIDVFPFPTGTGRLYGFGENFYISTQSDAPDAAAAFLDYFVSDAVQQSVSGLFGSISINSNVTYTEISPLNQRWMDIFAQYGETFINGDQAFPLDVTTEYFRVINEVASDVLAPEEAGAAMQAFIASR